MAKIILAHSTGIDKVCDNHGAACGRNLYPEFEISIGSRSDGHTNFRRRGPISGEIGLDESQSMGARP
jgi:hypothetical protein